MKKKIIIVTLIAIIALLALTGCNKVAADTEIIVNGNFEDFDGKDMAGWSVSSGATVTWSNNTNDGSSEYDPALGKRFLTIKSSGYNYVYQTVRLEKGATYRISADIYASSLTGVAGVYFEGAYELVGVATGEVTDGWVALEDYFTSSVGGNVKLVVAVGSEFDKSTGTTDVRFDNVSLQKVNGVDEEIIPMILRMSEGYTMTDSGSLAFVILFTLISLGIFAGMFFIIKGIIQNKAGIHPSEGDGKADKFLNAMTCRTASFIYVLLAAFFVRFIVVLASAAGNDLISSWSSLASSIASMGYTSFYESGSNEPQGVIWLLGIFGYIGNGLGLSDIGFGILIRMPMVIADLLVCYMVYGCAAKYQNERMAIAYGFIYALLPIFFIFGSLYGSIQCIAIAFIVAMALSMLKKRYVSTGIFYTLALFFSNYALLLLPVILLYQIYGLVTDKSSVVKTSVTMASCLVVFYLLSLPLCWSGVSTGNVLMVFRKMYAFFDVSNPWLSNNTFNLYSIFAAGGRSRADNVILNMGNWLFVIGMCAYAVFHYIRTANRLDLILLSGMIFVAYSAIGAQATLDVLPIGLVLVLIYLIVTPDIRLYIGTGILSALAFLNTAQLLARSGFIGGADTAALLDFEDKNAFMIIFSILTVATVIYLLYVCVDITLNSYVKPIAKDKVGISQVSGFDVTEQR